MYLRYPSMLLSACINIWANIGNLKIHRSKANGDGNSHFNSYLSSPLLDTTYR